jgi:choline dehydrogenase-like flavoprotein
MIIDFKESGSRDFHCDICIVGAGAAGIALALEFAGRDVQVLVVESGGLEIEPESKALLSGDADSQPFPGFEEGRARAFGGTTRLWAGQCIRLDPIDFESRGWVPKSGWPIDAGELSSCYEKAENFMGLYRPRYDGRLWQDVGLSAPQVSENLVPKFTIYTPDPDFKRRFTSDMRRSRNVSALLHATVTEIVLDSTHGTVEYVEVGCPGRPRQKVFARQFALCAGGIESARLLLASNRQVQGGLGNESDLVGRYFQDHPNACTAKVITDDPRRLQRQFAMLRRSGVRHWPKLALSEAAQRRFQVLNGNANFFYEYSGGSTAAQLKRAMELAKSGSAAAELVSCSARLLSRSGELLREFGRWRFKGQAPVFRPSSILVRAFTEQQPDAENRVELSDQIDPLGVPKPRLKWRISDLELQTLRVVTRLVKEEIERLRLGQVVIEPWLAEGERPPQRSISDAYHHAGTTRMSTDRKSGVVDTDCRVHGISNLYVVSGSVFPTSGYANPTLTIIALAIRTAGTLQTALGTRH